MSTDSTVFQTGHVGLNVTDVKRSTEFYQRVFDFEIMSESSETGREYTFLGKGGQLILTLWQQSTSAFKKHDSGLHHLSFQIDSMEVLVDIQDKLQKLNIQQIYDGIVPHAEGASSGALFFEDPDGIRLEIFTPSGAENLNMQSEGASCGFF